MKRKLFSVLLCLLLLGTLVLSVSAKAALVMDFAGLLTSEEVQSLQQRSQQLKESTGLDVVILTTPELLGKSPQAFADDFYDNNGFCESGVLLLLDMGSRQWHISTAGSAIDALSDRDLMAIEDRVIPYFSDGDYYEGFCRFQDVLPGYLAIEQEGGFSFLLSAVVGAVVAGIAILVMRGLMNTRQPQRSAENYEIPGSYRLNRQRDLFLYSNISKTPRQQSSSSGSSVHRSSSGRSHGGRGGKF